MYKREWLKAVEEFFREKNRAWLATHEDTLLHYLAGSPADCHSWQDVRSMREAVKQRDVRYRKARTQLQILSAKWNQGQEQAVVEARETVRFYYEQGEMIEHESRQYYHRLVLIPFGGRWRVVQDETDRDQGPLVRSDEADAHVLDEEMIAGYMEGMEQLEDLHGTKTPRGAMRGRYDRVRAYKYSELWWNSYNPQFQRMSGNDCTNFISQVLWAGGMPMVNTGSRSSGWWYGGKSWSYSWAVAHSLRLALPRYLHAQGVTDPRLLKVGDIICYDWDGDGRWQHNTVVVDFDRYGMPLVNAHTIASHRRYWDYRDSYAFTPRTQYLCFHILDTF
ncbi:MAG: amidase domain-containing protein [Tumebacillaceae bacterium]